jgi:hypothetical protein
MAYSSGVLRLSDERDICIREKKSMIQPIYYALEAENYTLKYSWEGKER